MRDKNLAQQNKCFTFDVNRNKKEKPEKRSAKRKKELQKIIADMKEQSGCVDCESKFPYYVLDFDHVYGKKVANISSMLDYYSLEDIFKEISKCDIVCANCHRERTFHRKHNRYF
jgi:hypothetical protein